MKGKKSGPSVTDVPSQIGNWLVGDELGRGAFSGVYSAKIDPKSVSASKNGDFECVNRDSVHLYSQVLKMSCYPETEVKNIKKKTKKQKEIEAGVRLLFWEYQLYQNFLKDIDCIPRRPLQSNIYGETKHNGFVWKYLAIEKLEFTLRQKIDEAQHFSPALVASIAIQLIQGLEKIHSKGLLFRDIKAENIMFNNGKLYFVDFGASCKFIQHTGKHVETGSVAGTDLFMSVSCHESQPPSRRDDLISVFYLLAYIINSNSNDKGEFLPWENAQNETEVIKMKKMLKSDIFNNNNDGSPQMEKFFTLADELGTEKKPDYNAFVQLFIDLAEPEIWFNEDKPIKERAAPVKKITKRKFAPKTVRKKKEVKPKPQNKEMEEIPEIQFLERRTSARLRKKRNVPDTNSDLASSAGGKEKKKLMRASCGLVSSVAAVLVGFSVLDRFMQQ